MIVWSAVNPLRISCTDCRATPGVACADVGQTAPRPLHEVSQPLADGRSTTFYVHAARALYAANHRLTREERARGELPGPAPYEDSDDDWVLRYAETRGGS